MIRIPATRALAMIALFVGLTGAGTVGAAERIGHGQPRLAAPSLMLHAGGRHDFRKSGLRLKSHGRGFHHRGRGGGFRGKLHLPGGKLVLRFGDLDHGFGHHRHHGRHGFRSGFDRRDPGVIPSFRGLDPIPSLGSLGKRDRHLHRHRAPGGFVGHGHTHDSHSHGGPPELHGHKKLRDVLFGVPKGFREAHRLSSRR